MTELTLDDFEVGQVWVSNYGDSYEVVCIEPRADEPIFCLTKTSEMRSVTIDVNIISNNGWKLQKSYEPSEAEIDAACEVLVHKQGISNEDVKAALIAADKVRGE